jgi:putative transposase
MFHDDSDCLVYLRLLRDACSEADVEIWAYALMVNHYHLIAVPAKATSISRALQKAHTSYASYFNAKYCYVGHVWHSRPRMCAMDEKHLWHAVRYVERNPVRAGKVVNAEDYAWSSAAAHCGLRKDPLLSDNFPPAGFISNWSEWLKDESTLEDRRAICRHTVTGKPWVQPEYLVQLEAMTGRKLTIGRVGRPPKPRNREQGEVIQGFE